MSFIDCACHVWAIDGYTDDNTADLVNKNYMNKANELMGKRMSKHNKLLELIKAARQNGSTDIKVFIYGGWQNTSDGAPMHMWIEVNGYIYDTMPGYPLCRVIATAKTQIHPVCEREPFIKRMVGVVPAKLTVSQLKILNEAKWKNDEYTP